MVYCKECKHRMQHWGGYTDPINLGNSCEKAGVKYEDTPCARIETRILPDEKNANNDCKDFVKKPEE